MSIEIVYIIGYILILILLLITILKLNKLDKYKNNGNDKFFNKEKINYKKLVRGNYFKYRLNVKFFNNGIEYRVVIVLGNVYKNYQLTNSNAFKLICAKSLFDKALVIFKGTKVLGIYERYSDSNLWVKEISRVLNETGEAIGISKYNLLDIVDENTVFEITGIELEKELKIH